MAIMMLPTEIEAFKSWLQQHSCNPQQTGSPTADEIEKLIKVAAEEKAPWKISFFLQCFRDCPEEMQLFTLSSDEESEQSEEASA